MPCPRAASKPPPSLASESLPRTIATRPSGQAMPDSGSASGDSIGCWPPATPGIHTPRTAINTRHVLFIDVELIVDRAPQGGHTGMPATRDGAFHGARKWLRGKLGSVTASPPP